MGERSSYKIQQIGYPFHLLKAIGDFTPNNWIERMDGAKYRIVANWHIQIVGQPPLSFS